MRAVTSISIENFLSLRKLDLRLNDLNVLVGANGVGKTNILKVFEFLGEVARKELVPAIQGVGGFDQLLFRGSGRSSASVRINLTGNITKHSSLNAPDEYRLTFWRPRVRSLRPDNIPELFQRNESLIFKRYQGAGRRITLSGGRVTVATSVTSGKQAASAETTLGIQGQATGLGTLRRLSEVYGASEWNAFAEVVEQLRLFEIDVDKVRLPTRDRASSQLMPNASNLAAFLLWLKANKDDAFSDVCTDVKFVLPSFEGFEFTEIGGADNAVRLDIKEAHLTGTTPLARASFGTIRAIALFAMLHDPSPPKLTCLEEVDHGLHPHALDRVVERLRQASKRTQILLATHSPALVNRLQPSELIIVEHEDETGASRITRPDNAMVGKLSKETGYELGELWFSGILGGTLN